MKKFVLPVLIISVALILSGCGSHGSNVNFTQGSHLYEHDSFLFGIPVGTDCATVKSNFDSATGVKCFNPQGHSLPDNDMIVTGTKVRTSKELTVIIAGDTDGDGNASEEDCRLVQGYFTGNSKLTAVAFMAADITGDYRVTSTDYIKLRHSLEGKYDLYQGMNAVPYQSLFEEKEYDMSDYRMDRSKLNIGIYGYPKGPDSIFIDERYVKELKEDFGVDFITSGSDTEELYKLCDQYGIGMFATKINYPKYTYNSEEKPVYGDWSIFDNLENDTYTDYDCFWGDEVFDEPTEEYFSWCSRAQQIYDGHFKDKFIFFNLNPSLPVETGEPCFSANSYEDYINKYVEKVDTDYICFDVYPFDNYYEGLRPSYLYNLDVVASAARESGKDFWIITQSGNNDAEYVMNKAQLQWQTYLSLAYGAKTLIYSTYTPWWWADGTCMINKDGTKTDLWYAGQQLNREIKALSPVYMQYESLGVSCVIGNALIGEEELIKQNERAAERGYAGARGFKNIEATNGLVVGSFEKRDGNGYAMMLVESSDAYNMEASTTITFRTANSSGSVVTAYIAGEAEILTAADGVYTVTLESGQGCFVTVE